MTPRKRAKALARHKRRVRQHNIATNNTPKLGRHMNVMNRESHRRRG